DDLDDDLLPALEDVLDERLGAAGAGSPATVAAHAVVAPPVALTRPPVAPVAPGAPVAALAAPAITMPAPPAALATGPSARRGLAEVGLAALVLERLERLRQGRLVADLGGEEVFLELLFDAACARARARTAPGKALRRRHGGRRRLRSSGLVGRR